MILLKILVNTTQFFSATVPFQVADGRGNCTPHRNPTPCTIPQDRESIFHSIFAFFTKSGRKVLVNMQPSSCTLTFQRSLTVTPCEGCCCCFLVSATSVYHTSSLSPTHFLPLSPPLCFFLLLCLFQKDCDRPGRACMTISCSLGPQLKEEALSIDMKLLLNTEILKRVGNMSQA